MHGNLPAANGTAITPAAHPVSAAPDISTQSDGQSDSDWFPAVCRAVYGKDAGLALHYATNVPERSCYRYAAGERELPSLVLRAILHSEQGGPFLAALMDGCTAPWWLEHKRAAEIGKQVLEITGVGK